MRFWGQKAEIRSYHIPLILGLVLMVLTLPIATWLAVSPPGALGPGIRAREIPGFLSPPAQPSISPSEKPGEKILQGVGTIIVKESLRQEAAPISPGFSPTPPRQPARPTDWPGLSLLPTPQTQVQRKELVGLLVVQTERNQLILFAVDKETVILDENGNLLPFELLQRGERISFVALSPQGFPQFAKAMEIRRI